MISPQERSPDAMTTEIVGAGAKSRQKGENSGLFDIIHGRQGSFFMRDSHAMM
jgi:hypothetical protein